MLFKSLRSRLQAVETRLFLICEELEELRLLQKKGKEASEEASCASLIDEWINGREEK